MAKNSLFPLPLTSFEQAVMVDDRPAYPMTPVYRLRFIGYLDRRAFESAIEMVTQRHPLMKAIIQKRRFGRFVWVNDLNWKAKVYWEINPQLTPSGWPQMRGIDPTQESGIRWWVIKRDKGHDVVLQGHHCIFDGAGINTVIEDLLTIYASKQNQQTDETPLRSIDAQRLHLRGAPKYLVNKDLKIALKQYRGFVGILEFLGRSPRPLMGEISTVDHSQMTPKNFPAILTYKFDLIETKKIRMIAKALKVTENMLLLRELFLVISKWRKKQGLGSHKDWLRIGVPMNLRGSADEAMPMTNSLSMVFLDRKGSDFDDGQKLLSGIYEQLWLIKRFHLQYTYILTLGLVRLFPGSMARMFRSDTCQSTTYLSNLGSILSQSPLPRKNEHLVCGNVVLDSIDNASVLRPHTNVGFLVYNYAGRLHLSMQYDARVVLAEQADDLLDMFVEHILRTIEDNQKSE